jgi:hypothetical protein
MTQINAELRSRAEAYHWGLRPTESRNKPLAKREALKLRKLSYTSFNLRESAKSADYKTYLDVFLRKVLGRMDKRPPKQDAIANCFQARVARCGELLERLDIRPEGGPSV